MSETMYKQPLGGAIWNRFTHDTPMTAEDYVDAIAVLLQGVLESNGKEGPEVLIDQLRATLSLGGPHSALPLTSSPRRANNDLIKQADVVSKRLITWADEALARRMSDPVALPGGKLEVRSNCYGHSLIEPAKFTLLGPKGGPTPMMLFNEWIHQMVLLRDALLPFTNWQEVPLLVDERGLRRIEKAREEFLGEMLVRQIRHTSIVNFARHAVDIGGSPAAEGYGFAYERGSVLPSVVNASTVLVPTHLLTWSSERATVNGAVSMFIPRESSYFSAQRTEAATHENTDHKASLAGATTCLSDELLPSGDRYADIEVTVAEKPIRVDLGQALRGHRYSYPVAGAASEPADGAARWLRDATPIDAGSVIEGPGMAWSKSGDYSIEAGQDGLASLALLGAIYPENVVVRLASSEASPTSVGKTGPARFVITLPDE